MHRLPHHQQHLIHHPLPLNAISSHTACAQDKDAETASECEQEPDHYSDAEESFELLSFLPTDTSATKKSARSAAKSIKKHKSRLEKENDRYREQRRRRKGARVAISLSFESKSKWQADNEQQRIKRWGKQSD